MGRCCALVFGILGIIAMLNGIAANVIGYYTCWYMTPYNNNISNYIGYYKICCATAWRCLPPYTIYSAASITAIAVSWGLCFIFFVIAGCCRRRAARRQMQQMGMGFGGIQMNTTGTPVVAYGYAY